MQTFLGVRRGAEICDEPLRTSAWEAILTATLTFSKKAWSNLEMTGYNFVSTPDWLREWCEIF